MKTFKERIKTYSFWTGLSASVVLLINAIAKCFGFSVDNSLVEDIMWSACRCWFCLRTKVAKN